MNRRSVLTGFGALGVAGCTPLIGEMMNWDRDMEAVEARHGGRLGIAVSASNRSLAYNPEHRFVYCSTFKMYLAAATLLRVQAGEERLDRAVPVTAADMLSTAPVTQPAVGETLTIEQLMKGTVEVSDNPAANILIRELGGLDAMRAFYRGIGDQSTTVDRMEMELNRVDGDKDTITPKQCVANLHRLFVDAQSPLSAESRDRLLGWMFASPTGAARIKAGVPTGWRVAHKTGTGGYGPTNDIGVLYPPSGDPVCIAVYFHATESSTPAQREAVIADATRIALKALGYDVAA
ncbi:class A beta-lactamase [Brevundimonas sp.]|uniref:class A beta-lactamase n=1 Tax=Brevundimonas sp. TaxID=1871086 RepID=UPI002FCBC2E7